MCKPFPPPLVRGGVFLVGSDTKYRDIADGNLKPGLIAHDRCGGSDTKYRDIADGNSTVRTEPSSQLILSDTKYRDIADGNHLLQQENP